MVPDVDFRSLSIWTNLGVFVVAAAAVWFAGTRLASRADAIADRTGLGKAFVGLVLLAGATSLPEIATTATAATTGNAALAINNLLGGIAMQTAILSIADLYVARGPLTFLTPRPVLLLQGTTLIVLLGLVLAALAAGPVLSFAHVGVWTALIFGLYLLAVYLTYRYEGSGRWRPVDPPGRHGSSSGAPQSVVAASPEDGIDEEKSTTRVAVEFAAFALVVLAAGYVLARVADALSAQTGMGATFIGATLLAISTSLPEVSTTVQAARLGSYSMAIANVFGSNALMVGLLFPADLLYGQGPILSAVGPPVSLTAAAGVVVTAIYLAGLIEREDRQVGRMGLDSVAVLICYVGATVVLYLIA